MIRITVREASGDSRVHEFPTLPVRIGRDPSNDLVVRDAYVSSRHGELRDEGGRLVYEDLHTTNGSLRRRGTEVAVVDGRTLHRTRVEEGDGLLLGDATRPVELVVSVVTASSARPAGSGPWALGDVRELDATRAETIVEIPASFDREVLLALNRLTTRLSGPTEVPELLESVSQSLLEAFRRANHVSIHVLDSEDGHREVSHACDHAGPAAASPISRTVRDAVLSRGKAIAFSVHDADFDESASLHEHAVRAGLCAPLWDGQRVIGLVQVDCRGARAGSFGTRDLEVLAVFAHQAAMALQNARLHENLRRTCEQSIRGLVRALEAKDHYTSGHSEAVADLCVRVAVEAGHSPHEIDTLRRAALLHDLGKIGIPYTVLNKEGRLTPEEFAVLRTHPEVGARILEPFGFLSELVPIVLYHHERWDGRGYPTGLAGEDVPLGARILSVVDTYHALTSDRAYRAGVMPAVALAEVRRWAGTQFDPIVVEQLAAALQAAGVTTATEDGAGTAPRRALDREA
jgi:putative nucleotidyltransferase with HDIG domain